MLKLVETVVDGPREDGAVRLGSFLVKMLSYPMCILQSGRVQGYAFFVVIGVLVFFGYYVVR